MSQEENRILLHNAREALGVDDAGLGDYIGVHKVTISEWRCQRRMSPPVMLLLRLIVENTRLSRQVAKLQKKR